jgi:hypothetical protein
VLVYAYDCPLAGKQAQALEVLDSLVLGGVEVIGAQILAEFFNLR